MSNETTRGWWWLPNDPDKRLVGELTYGPTNGAQLRLLNHFSRDIGLTGFTVWGITAKAKPVTLFNCRTKNIVNHLPGASVSEISSYFGVVGGHFNSPEEMRFVSVRAELNYLREWAWRSGINVVPNDSEKGWTVHQNVIPDVPLGEGNGFALSLEFTSTLSPEYGQCKLSESCALKVTTESLRAYESFEETIHRFQSLVALGVSRPVFACSIKAQTDKPKKLIKDHPVYEEFQIIRKLSIKGEPFENLLPEDMQFCLPDMQPDPAKYVEMYFRKHRLLEPVCDFYFSTLYDPGMYTQQRFLALAHALEAYHRAFIGGKYQSDKDYKNGLQKILFEAIPQTVDADFRTSLKNKLRYLHEFSLRKRIQDIGNRFANILSPFLEEPAVFASIIADQRNSLTHPDSTNETPTLPVDWSKLWLKSEQMSLLLEACLLHEIGFSDETIAALLPRNHRTRAIQLNS